jgi:hypothetical protein
MDRVSDKVHAEFESLAAKHPTYETYMQDVERFAEAVWHNARVHKEQGTLVGAEEVPQPETPVDPAVTDNANAQAEVQAKAPTQDKPVPEDAAVIKASAKAAGTP